MNFPILSLTLFIFGCGQENQAINQEKSENPKGNQIVPDSTGDETKNSTIHDSIILSANMKTARAAHTATLLKDGQVLICGGFAGSTLSSAEIYNSNSKTFKQIADMTAPRAGHSATL